MDNPLLPACATDATGLLPGLQGLRLDETYLPLRALHGTAEQLNKLLPIGQKCASDQGLWLRLWPQMLWVSGKSPKANFRSADISHGQCHLRLRGVEALFFLAQYVSADLNAAAFRRNRTIRTRIGAYDTVLWWDSTRDVHLLLERSVAQSFCDHLRALTRRNDPADPSKTPRPVHPAAPDRRG